MSSRRLLKGVTRATKLVLPWLAMFLTIVGARLWLIDRFGTALPILDQWDGEGAFLLKPWVEGSLRLADIFSAHNEHRIVASRLLVLGLFQLNGQWDALLEMVVNAFICGMIATVFAMGLLRLFGIAHRSLILLTLTLWSALPYGQENTLWGFQSAFYFLIFFSICALWLLLLHPALSRSWWLGIASGVFACFTIGSGSFASLIVLCIAALHLLLRRNRTKTHLATAAAASLIVFVSWTTRAAVPQHAAYRASSVEQWLSAFGSCISWPFPDQPLACVLLYLPLALLGLRYVRDLLSSEGKETCSGQVKLLLAVGAWVLLQGAAMSYSRGGHEPVSSRYMDILAFGPIANLLAWGLLIRTRSKDRLPSAAIKGAIAVWTIAVLLGAGHLSYQQVLSQAGRKAYLLRDEENVRAYVLTGDRKHLDGQPGLPIPYPDARRLALLLDDPSIRKILPSGVRPPLKIMAAISMGEGFIPGGCGPEVLGVDRDQTWGSYSASGNAATGSMETTKFTPSFPYLEVQIAGYLRQGLSLSLRDAVMNDHRPVIPTTRVDKFWRNAIVPTKQHEYSLVGRDESKEGWFAFRGPRELGRLSYYAARLTLQGKLICIVGLTIWLLVAAENAMMLFKQAARN